MSEATEAAGIDAGSKELAGSRIEPTCVWGLPLSPLSSAEAIEVIARRIEARKPSYFITANLNYAMLSARSESLRRLNKRAFLILADGMPLVWASHWSRSRGRKCRPLPGRVRSSDLILALSAMAERRSYRVFLLGGGPGEAKAAARNLTARYPGLRLVGTESPPLRALSVGEHDALINRIRSARPDLLLVAFGQPKGEIWLAGNLKNLGVPVAVQLGASLDFAAGQIRQSPRWLQQIGLGWAFRLLLGPRRLGGRHLANVLFLLRCVASDLARACGGRPPGHRIHRPSSATPNGSRRWQPRNSTSLDRGRDAVPLRKSAGDRT
jgi:N-acetylglucosaminyldiphosphoundecaprenol N-acetyl-beta-D-mannosaminyltransferase